MFVGLPCGIGRDTQCRKREALSQQCRARAVANARRPLKRRARLRSSAVGAAFALASTTLGRLLFPRYAASSSAPFTGDTGALDSAASAASASALALRGPAHKAGHHF